MTEQDYQLLSQYIDGELPTEEVTALKKRLLAEPELNQLLAKMQKVNQAVVGHYRAAPEQVPQHVTAMVSPPKSASRYRLPLALAASVAAAALFISTPAWRDSGSGADYLLSAALENTPSRAFGWEALTDGRQLRPILSFRVDTGAWCREYLLRDRGTATRGVACRENGRWETLVAEVEVVPQGEESHYRPAGTDTPRSVSDYIDQHSTEDPLSAAVEQTTIERGWR